MPDFPFPFPADTLSMVESAKVNWYYRRYAEEYYREYRIGHFLLAAYAAVPALLTPDLLYKLWQNFSRYTWGRDQTSIHRIAVADLLLSPFCREAGFELYEMNHEIRLCFLQWLENERESDYWRSCNLPSTDDIARFSEAYHLQSNPGNTRWGISYNDAQSFEALSFYDPAQAAQRLFSRIHSLSAASRLNESELLTILDLFIKTSQRLKRRKDGQGYSYFHGQEGWMNAWKELLQTNTKGFIDKLNKDPELLALLDDTSEGGIEVVLSKGVVESIHVLAPRKLKALVVGMDCDGSEAFTGQGVFADWASSFAQLLQELETKNESVFITHLDNETSKDRILEQWRSLVENAGEEDDLLLYLAGESTVEQGHCLVRCPGEKGAAASDGMQFLADAEIGSIANDSRCASVTLVLEVDQCGTGFWLDPGKTGNCVFASGRYEERNGSGQHIDNRERGIFTKAMITGLRKSGLRVTNRQLFVDVLSEYRQLTQLLYSNSGVGDEIHPDLYCHEESYQHFFLRGRNYMVQLQDALRAAGYLDKESTGKWDLETSAALKTFCEEAGVQGLLTKQQYISLLEELSRQQATLAPPVFLVVFADEQNSLLLDARKESGILDAVRLIQRKAVVSLMWQPSRKAISEFFMDPVNRNRIQLLYVAGLYGNQDPAAGDGPVTLADLAAFLPFQQNLKLFFSNTRLSGDLADYATRIGLPLAIANMDEVYYADAAEHGMRVMNGIASSAAPVEWLETGGGNFKTFSATKSIDLSRPIWDWQDMPEMQKKDSSSRRIVSLLVGIDKYRNVSPLNGCVNGARKMGGMLSLLNQHEKFDVAGVTELADEEATRENMLQRFNQLFEAANPGDACLLYFSGHAANQSFTENRLMPVDYNPSIAGTDITQDLFIQNLERANREKTCQVILVIDSHSGYYRWVGEDDIMIGAVRHSIQTEQAFPGHETSSAFIIALTDIIKSCNGLITYRHLQAWLRFTITEEFNLPGELPVVMASASNYDQYFLTRVRRTTDDLPLVAYNKNLSRWQLIEEDFKKVPFGGAAPLFNYENNRAVDNASGQFFVDLDRILFGGALPMLDKSRVYVAGLARPSLPVYFPAGMSGYSMIRQALEGFRFDRFSTWGDVALIAENVKQDGHYDEGLYIEEADGGYLFRLLPGRGETELSDLDPAVVPADQVKSLLNQFVRYHYLFNLEYSYPMYDRSGLLSVRMHYRWKKADATGNEFGRRKLKLSEEAMRFTGGTVLFNTLEVQVSNEEEFTLFCEVYLILSDLSIRRFPSVLLSPIQPKDTIRFELDEQELLERILIRGLSGQIKLMASRDPVRVDFSQILTSK